MTLQHTEATLKRVKDVNARKINLMESRIRQLEEQIVTLEEDHSEETSAIERRNHAKFQQLKEEVTRMRVSPITSSTAASTTARLSEWTEEESNLRSTIQKVQSYHTNLLLTSFSGFY